MSAANEVKDDRKYTKDHEWCLKDGEAFKVGITAFAVDQLGDITLVDISVKEGAEVEAGKAFGTIESVKTLSDLYAPVSGKVIAINPELENAPEVINDDCWGKGWMIAIQPSDPAAADALMDPADYGKHLEESDH